jgi:uncharacterized protein
MRSRPVLYFFASVLALSAPLWWLGATGFLLLPGLPVSGLMAFTPCLAALIVVRGERGWPGALQFLGRSGDWRVVSPKAWWIVLIGAMPAMLTIAYLLMSIAGASLPETPRIALTLAPLLLLAFFLAALGEELGWMGFAFDPLRARFGLLNAAFILAAFWTAWHVIPYLQTGRALEWVLWHCVVTVALRLVMVWLYVRSGQSIAGISVFHAMSNVSYFLFPNGGSHYDPVYFAPVVCVAAIAASFSMRRAFQP